MDYNLANQAPDYKISEGAYFVSKTFVYPTGHFFLEATSRATLLGWPIINLTMGKCPETGRRKVAKGWVAIGRFAFGGLAIGQVAAGVLALSQLGFGLIFALSQAGFGAYKCAGQIAVAPVAAYGQVAIAGEEAIGQLGVGKYVLAQVGIGKHVFDMRRKDPEAERRFSSVLDLFRSGEKGQQPTPEKPPAPR